MKGTDAEERKACMPTDLGGRIISGRLSQLRGVLSRIRSYYVLTGSHMRMAAFYIRLEID